MIGYAAGNGEPILFSEECDLGSDMNTDEGEDINHACSSQCTVRNHKLWKCHESGKCELTCGNGRLDEGEECDFLSQPHSALSSQGFQGVTDGWETKLNPGCTQECTIKPGFKCAQSGSLLCIDTCHNGVLESHDDSRLLAEQCDTGGVQPGCDELCQIVDGFECKTVVIGLEQPQGGKLTSVCNRKVEERPQGTAQHYFRLP